MNKLINSSKLFLKKNGSTILTVAGAIGTIGTAVIASRDTIKVVKVLEEKKKNTQDHLTKKEIIKEIVPCYIPTLTICASTIACIFGANTLNHRQQASLASAYALLDRSYKEYRGKVKNILSQDSDDKIIKAVAKDHFEMENKENIDDDKQLFFDFHSLHFFNSTLEEVKEAEQELRNLYNKTGYASLNIFYEKLGVKCTDEDYEVGWSTLAAYVYGYDGIEFVYEKGIGDDGTEFHIINMVHEPTFDYLMI